MYRRENADAFEELMTVSASVFSYVDASPPSGVTLSYRLRAESDAGLGEESRESGKVEICAEGWRRVAMDSCAYPPDPPGSFVAETTGELDSPAVSLSWDAANAEGENVESYLLWRASTAALAAECSADTFAAELTVMLTIAAGDADSHWDSDVEYGSCYGYAIAATTSALLGSRATAAVYVRDVPGPPTALTATITGEGGVSLSWGAPDNLRGAEVSGWRVYRRENAGDFEELANVAAGVFSYVDAIPPSGATLSYLLRAESDAGLGQQPLEFAQVETAKTNNCSDGELPRAGRPEECRRIGEACGSAPEVHSGTGMYWRNEKEQAVCGCPDPGAQFQLGQECLPRQDNLTTKDSTAADLRGLCRAFQGEYPPAGGGIVCRGMDAANSFCILDSRQSLPCEGLMKHVRTCNLRNRFALNPFLCGRVCDSGQYAAGGKCCATNGICATPDDS